MKIATAAAIVASVAIAFPAPTAVADTVITGEGFIGVRGTTAKAFQGDFCKTQICTTVSNRPITVARQMDRLEMALANSSGPVSLMGYSLSAAAIYELVERWEDEPDSGPDPEAVRLVTLGNPRNRYGGSDRDEASATPLPVDQPYEHLDVALQYDSVADEPTRWGWYSMLNATLAQHLGYTKIDINAPENLVYEDGNTTYMLVPEPVLPMLKWRDWFTSDERMAELDAKYRPLVEKDYDRPDYVEQGEGADWVNGIEPPSLENEAVAANDVMEVISARQSAISISEDASGADEESGTADPVSDFESEFEEAVDGLDSDDQDGLVGGGEESGTADAVSESEEAVDGLDSDDQDGFVGGSEESGTADPASESEDSVDRPDSDDQDGN